MWSQHSLQDVRPGVNSVHTVPNNLHSLGAQQQTPMTSAAEALPVVVTTHHTYHGPQVRLQMIPDVRILSCLASIFFRLLPVCRSAQISYFLRER